MSIISLICYGISETFLEFKFPLQQLEFINDKIFLYTPYHTFGWQTSFHRNSGMFWEPGAYQIFLNLALIFMLDMGLYGKRDKIKIIILIITILTTKSTTGYIVLLIILSNYFYINIKFKYKFSKSLIVIIIAMMLIIIFPIFSKIEVVDNKINKDNISFNIRYNDFLESINIIKEYPMKGLGILSDKFKMIEESKNIHNNSNGVLYLTCMLGCTFSIIFYFIMFKNSRYLLKITNNIIFIIVVLLFHLTEVIVFMPIGLVFMFRFNNNLVEDEI
ncbi:O-antigen ligase family protein [Clostridium botulinum]|uniref:O-antigen ligase family protein n=1 Tax=Clostridium botulinum TaxID=1491 RepID=UPI0019684493|nr:O-antigen ligase family protein [Clostridium botulinum]